MREVVEIASCKTILDDNRGYVYRYFLVKNCKNIHVDKNEFSVKSYGIEAVREEILNGKIISIEREVVNHISPDRMKVVELIFMLQDNEVSPLHLYEVVGNYMDEWVYDFDREISKAVTQLVFM